MTQDMNGGSIQLPPQGSGGFNPNDSVYRSCCCHTKTFTIVTGILEIFTICFILVAIIPDVNSRLCEAKTYANVTLIYQAPAQNRTLPVTLIPPASGNNTFVVPEKNSTPAYKANMDELRQFVCDMNVGWLIGSILDIVAVNIMFYAIKSVRWMLFLPHLFFRVVIILLFLFGIALEVYSVIEGGANPGSAIVGILFTSVGGIFFIFVSVAEIRCAHFIKRSQETGYSISIARPIGPATISVSDQQQQSTQPQQNRAALPPLRHTYGNQAQKYTE